MAQTPTGSRVALVREQSVLLIKRSYEPFRNLWTFPGGGIEANETAAECAVREVYEEVGLRVRTLHSLGLQVTVAHREYCTAMYVTNDFEGEISCSDEVADFMWAQLDALAELDTTPGLFQAFERSLTHNFELRVADVDR